MNAYTSRVLDGLKARNAHESEFIQAATEILDSISPVFDKHPEYEAAGLLERAEQRIRQAQPDKSNIDNQKQKQMESTILKLLETWARKRQKELER